MSPAPLQAAAALDKAKGNEASAVVPVPLVPAVKATPVPAPVPAETDTKPEPEPEPQSAVDKATQASLPKPVKVTVKPMLATLFTAAAAIPTGTSAVFCNLCRYDSVRGSCFLSSL